jgi:hypothetical protein
MRQDASASPHRTQHGGVNGSMDDQHAPQTAL